MATYTSNYAWTKPGGNDQVDISVLNGNLDSQDAIMHKAFTNMAQAFSELSTYAVGDIVLYDNVLYKCHTAVTVAGAWTGSTNWQVYKLSEGGGGGTSNYNDLTNKPSINGVTLSGNKTTSDLGITASGVGAIPSTDKGANGGVAELDSNGKVPSSQLPSYVDDVLSYASQSAFPATGETGKIYIAEDTNKTYRWSGSAYAEISASLALGETSSTAYRGDRGKTAYDHSQIFSGNPHGTTKGDVGLGNVPNVATNDQEPTFTEASTRNNIASGEKLSVIFGKIQKFFNDLKTVAFSGKYTDLTDKPENANTFQGTIAEWNQLSTAEKKAYNHASIPDSIDGGVTFPADKVVMTGGGNVEDAIDNVYTATNGTGVSGTFHYTKIGRIVIGAGLMTMTQNLSEYADIVTGLPQPETITMGAFEANDSGYNRVFVNDYDNVGMITTRIARNSGDSIRLSCFYLAQS